MNPSAQFRRLALAIICPTLLASASIGAQFSANLSGPVLGYLFDANAGSLRPVQGILGSSTIGRPVELGFTLSQALTVGPRHVIASTDGQPDLLVLDLGASPFSITAIPGVPAGPSLAAASLHGTSAALYEAAGHRVWIVSGLPQNPAASYVIDLSMAGSVTQMGISDDGRVLVFSAEDRGAETLYSWTASSSGARMLMPVVSVGGIAMMENGAAIVADRAANEVYAVWDPGGAAMPQFLAGARDGVSIPVGVAVSAANRIYIANSGSATIMTLDSSGRLVKSQDCGCAVSGVHALRDSVFRLTNGLDRTVFLLDGSSSEDRILFVPKPEN
jgi:DNA-binding beta-propeller fold protein YncE